MDTGSIVVHKMAKLHNGESRDKNSIFTLKYYVQEFNNGAIRNNCGANKSDSDEISQVNYGSPVF